MLMEKIHLGPQQGLGWRSNWLSFKNATILVCLINMYIVLFLLQSFLPASSFAKFSSSHPPNKVLLRYIEESEVIRRAMMPLNLIRRVKEIEMQSFVVEPQEDTNQTAAVVLVSRLNNLRSYSDPGSLEALEKWRKRKMERARQRELGKSGSIVV